MTLAFDLGPRPLWAMIPIEDRRASELADRHYSRQTIGARGFVPPGRRFALWHEDARGAALWTVCLNRFFGVWRWRNTIFRNESGALSSTLIIAATGTTYDVWRIRYRELPSVPLTTEIAIEATARRRSKRHEPGHCYREAGWVERRKAPPYTAVRRASCSRRLVSKRTNPPRNVPRAIDHESGQMIGDRSRTDFAGSSTRRLERRTRKRADWERATATRIDGAHGSMPVSGLVPKPPPVLVLYPDMAGELGPQAVYGQYPRGLIKKILPWLRCQRNEVLHVCSGSLKKGEGIRVDIREAAKPDFLADGRNLPFEDGSHQAVMIDPPYSDAYARSLYNVDYPRPSHLLREAARVVRPGGRIAIVHYITPKPVDGTRFVVAFGLSTGFDMPMRAVTIFERDHPELAL